MNDLPREPSRASEGATVGAREMPRARLEALARNCGAKAFQARALCELVFDRGIRDLNRATSLPKSVRDALAHHVHLAASRVIERSISTDGTIKYLLELRDGESVEAVLIPEGERTTLCISSQVGCPVACVFCASGLDGVRRNLTAVEIVDQFLLARDAIDDGQLDDARGKHGKRRLTNLVVMGLGEPMLNAENLEQALLQISDDFGFSPRRITISTSGYPDRVERLAGRAKPWNLAVSLHAAEPSLRAELVPTATAAPADLVRAARTWFRATGREPTFEIVLLHGRNDRDIDADALIALLSGQHCTVNLIPWNPVDGVPIELRTPPEERVQSFMTRLESGGLNVTWRRRRGADRDAACGQLRLRKLEQS